MIAAAVATNIGYIGYISYKELREIKVQDKVKPKEAEGVWEVRALSDNEALIMPVDPTTGDSIGTSEWYNTSELERIREGGWVNHAFLFTALFTQKLAYESGMRLLI